MSSAPEVDSDAVRQRDARIAEGLGNAPLPADESAALAFGFILSKEPGIGNYVWFENWRDIRRHPYESAEFIETLRECHELREYQPVVDILTTPRPPEPQPQAPIPPTLPTYEAVKDGINEYFIALESGMRAAETQCSQRSRGAVKTSE